MKDINISWDCPWFWCMSLHTNWAHSSFDDTACPYFLLYPSSCRYHCSATCSLSISSPQNQWHGPQPNGLSGWARLSFYANWHLLKFCWNWNWKLFLFFSPTLYCWREHREFGSRSMFYVHLCNPSELLLQFGWFSMSSNLIKVYFVRFFDECALVSLLILLFL